MAHVILTGCTGMAGSTVLARCIASPCSPDAGADKVNVITYPESVLEQLKGAVGCVWALGVPAAKSVLLHVTI